MTLHVRPCVQLDVCKSSRKGMVHNKHTYASRAGKEWSITNIRMQVEQERNGP